MGQSTFALAGRAFSCEELAPVEAKGKSEPLVLWLAKAPLARAFLRYCLVAAGGLAVNYAVYSLCVVFWPLIGLTATPGVLPLFVAAGSGAAMALTFVGFRWFAFRA